MHKHARLTACGREILVRRIVEAGQSPRQVAEAFGLSATTVRKWLTRFRTEGVAGLADRSSRPHHSPRRIASSTFERIVRLRREWQTGVGIATAVLTFALNAFFMWRKDQRDQRESDARIQELEEHDG